MQEPNRMLKWFAVEHLPEDLQLIVREHRMLALRLDNTLPEGPEKSAGMRKLLEAKDCFVRAAIEGRKAE